MKDVFLGNSTAVHLKTRVLMNVPSKLESSFTLSDVCGPMSVKSLGGACYYVLFKDDHSGYRYVYFIKKKSEVFSCFQKLEKQSGL